MAPIDGPGDDPKVLALDIDGVIVHPAEDIGGAHWSVNLERDLGLNPDDLADVFFKRYWSLVVVGEADLEVSLGTALHELGSELSPQALMQYWFEKDGVLDESVAAFARRWRTATGGVVVAFTNQERNRMNYLRDVLRIDSVFDQVFWSGDLGVSKKQAQFFQIVLQRLQVRPDQILFFDDEQGVIDVAKTLGITAVLYTGVEVIQRALPLGSR